MGSRAQRGGAPASMPCCSCPYRRDAPSGVWAADEYAKLPGYDLPLAEQPPRVFFCHQQDARLCAGWVAVHDMADSLGLRLALSFGLIRSAAYEAALDYQTTVPLWSSGAEAARHGLAELAAPGDPARRVVRHILAKRRRRAQAETTETRPGPRTEDE